MSHTNTDCLDEVNCKLFPSDSSYTDAMSSENRQQRTGNGTVNWPSLIPALMMVAIVAAACGTDDEPVQQEEGMTGGTPMSEMPMMQEDMPMMQGEMPEWMMSRDGMAGMMEAMPTIHLLLSNHEEIERNVEDIPGGVRSITTSENPAITGAIREHVYQMKEWVEEGRPIRMMDPLFREIFEHHEKIEMEIEEVPGGVLVTETSSDPQVVLLIRQHAHRAVSEFVEEGMSRAMHPTPLPDRYEE